MFVDEVILEVIAGSGGDGCMAFRREKYIAMGGPFGGNGGKGADVIFKADEGLRTLIDLRYQKKIKGEVGTNGQGKNKNGKNANDMIVRVPVGTTVKDAETDVIIGDLVKNNQEIKELIRSSQVQLDALGYTEHSTRHITIVSNRAGEVLETLGYPEERIELAKIAGYMHDIGNCVNRVDHAHSGAILAYQILKEMGMPSEDRA